MPVGEGDADAGCQRDVPAGDAERGGGDGPGQPLGDVHDLLGRRRVLHQHRELVTAPPGHGLVRRDRRAEPARCLGKQQVAGAVPNRVIHPGEAV